MQRRQFMGMATGAGAVLLAGGCGFRLRGAYNYAFRSIYVQADANAEIANMLRRMLAAQVRLIEAPQKDQADAILHVRNELQEQVSAAYAAGGSVREVQLRLSLDFALDTPEGKTLIEQTRLQVVRDVSYSESEATAKQAEFATLFRDMRNDIVQQVLRRLAAVKSL